MFTIRYYLSGIIGPYLSINMGRLFFADPLVRKNLTGVNFKGVELDNSDLSNADLSGADLREASVVGVNFYRTNLSNCNLNHARIFSKPGKIYQDPKLNEIYGTLEGETIQHAHFDRTVFHILEFPILKALKIDLSKLIFVDDYGKRVGAPERTFF